MDYFADEIKLENKRALIRNMKQSDYDELKKIAFDPDIWKQYPYKMEDEFDLQDMFNKQFADYKNRTRIPFVIIDKQSGQTAGCTTYMNIAMEDKRLEIGSTWLARVYHGTGLNKYCKYLLLEYAFNEMGIIRVEFKTDVLNIASRKALLKIGATEEGILRSHMQVYNGRRRDSIYFSILKDEWEDVKEKYFKGVS